jgi:hypothetical protein
MARRTPVSAKVDGDSCVCRLAHRSASCVLGIVFACLAWATPAVCQTASQQFVFAVLPATSTTSQIIAFSKNGANGALSPVPGTPLAGRFEGGPVAVDALGRFLFILNRVSNSISMYQVDESSGAIVEAPGSPFAVNAATAPDGTLLPPTFLATEASGQFLYVGYGIAGVHGTILQLVIDASNSASPQLNVSSVAPPIDVPSTPFALLVDAKGLFLYAGLSGEAVTGGYTQTNVYAITTGSGQLVQQGAAGQINPYEISIAIGGRGKVFFDGSGVAVGALESALISPSDGTAAAVASTIALGLHNIPSAMLADGSGSFLYVRQSAGIDVYSIDATSGALSATSATTATLAFETGQASADPEGAYIYSSQSDGIHGFQIDPQSGSLSEVAGSPFATPVSGAGWLAMSGTPFQAASGPFAIVFPASQTFGSENLGQSSDPKTIGVTNTGNQALVLTGLTVQGPNAGDFGATSSCSLPTVLPPNSNTSGTCSVSVIFSPSAAGLRQASLVFADNGPGNPQIVPLSGTGVALTPFLTITPASLSFPTTTQGSTSAPMSATLTSSGAVTLHIASIAVVGSNPSDFNVATSNCAPGAYAPNSSCTLSVVFAPSGPDQRSASIVITDDAPSQSQSIALSGAGVGPAVAKPTLGIAPASLLFGPSTQGTISSPQTLVLTNSGSAPIHLMSSIAISGTNASEFVLVSNSCAVGAYSMGSACSISLKFAPLGTGQRTAAIQITDDAAGSPQTVAIAGQSNPAFTVGPPPVGGFSQTVTAGQTATYNLQLLGGSGFSGSVTFVCAGAPAKVTCNPPSATQITGGKTSTAVITIATTASSFVPSAAIKFLRLVVPTRIDVTLLLLWIWVLVLLKRCALSSSDLIRPRATCAVLVVLLAVAGCAGAAAPAPQTEPVVRTAGTPQGTYAITLTPAVTTASQQQLPAMQPISLTLVVD